MDELRQIEKEISEVRDHHDAIYCAHSSAMRDEIMNVIEAFADRHLMSHFDVLFQVALHDEFLRDDILERMQ